MARILEKIRNKIVNHVDWWKDYMTEMSILVISLAATFYGENLIQSYQEAQDDDQIMTVVVNELESNIKEVSNMLEYYRSHKTFAQALKQNLIQHETVVADTMQRYENFHRLLYFWILKKNALDMMKESGTMQRMENRDLLEQVIDTYEWIAMVKGLDIQFRDNKKEQIANFISRIDKGEPAVEVVGQWWQIDRDQDFKRFLIYSAPLQSMAIASQLEDCRDSMYKTIELIKQNYNIKDIEIH